MTEMDNKVQFTGLHRAYYTYGDRVLYNNSFEISKKPKEWLGTGIYFWLNMSDAEWWNDGIYDYSYILQADVVCNADEFKDLDNPAEMDAFEDFLTECWDALRETNDQLEYMSSDRFKTAMCNYYKEQCGIKLMKYSFPDRFEKNALGFRVPVGRPQLCASSNEIIHNIKKVKEIRK